MSVNKSGGRKKVTNMNLIHNLLQPCSAFHKRIENFVTKSFLHTNWKLWTTKPPITNPMILLINFLSFSFKFEYFPSHVTQAMWSNFSCLLIYNFSLTSNHVSLFFTKFTQYSCCQKLLNMNIFFLHPEFCNPQYLKLKKRIKVLFI